MADYAYVIISSESIESSRSSSSETSGSSSSILEISGEQKNLVDQQMGEPDMRASSSARDSLFPPRDDEDPPDWVAKDPWDWWSYFYKHGEDVFTGVYVHK